MLQKVLISAALLTLLANWFVFDAVPGLGLTLFLLVTNFYLYVFRNPESSETKWGLIASALSTVFALLFIVRANPLVQAVNFFAAVFSMGIAGYLYKVESGNSFLEKIVWYPFVLLGNTLTAFGEAYSEVKQAVSKKKESSVVVPAVLRGLVFAAPLVLVLLILLGTGDQVFSRLIETSLERIDIFSHISERSVFSAIVAVGAILVAFAKVKPHTPSFLPDKQTTDRSIELSVIAGSVGVVFAAFILVQIQYLFIHVGERELESLGISATTYSEYVRQGFFQLLIASVLASGVIITVLRYLKKHAAPAKEWMLRGVTAVVSIETLLVLFSAAKRLFLYADEHGLTRSRIAGFVFLIWLGLLLIFCIARLIKKLQYNVFLTSVVITTCLSIISLTVWNIDRTIAVDFQPTVNEEIDYEYISTLSGDAVDGWKEGVEHAEQLIAELEAKPILTPDDNRKLYYVQFTLYNIRSDVQYLHDDTEWRSYNVGRQQARQVVTAEDSIFARVPDLITRVEELQKRVTDEARQSTQLDR